MRSGGHGFSPGLVSAPHGGGLISLPPLVKQGVHKLEDVSGAEQQGGARVQHRGLGDALPVYEGVCVGAVRCHRHHALAVHQVAVVGQDSWAQELGGGGSGKKH